MKTKYGIIKIAIATIFGCASICANAEIFEVQSPNGEAKAILDAKEKSLNISLIYKGKTLIKNIETAMPAQKCTYGTRKSPYSLDRRFAKDSANPAANFNQIELNVGDQCYRFSMRVYDDGVFAHRFNTTDTDKNVYVYDELLSITPSDGAKIHLLADSKTKAIAKIKIDGKVVSISELSNTPIAYPRLALQVDDKANTLKSAFKKIANAEADEPDYIACTEGTAKFPWRIYSISEKSESEAKLLSAQNRLSSKAVKK